MQSTDDRLVFVDVEAVGSVRKPHVIQIAAIATNGKMEELAGFEAKAQLPKGGKPKPSHSRYNKKLWDAEGSDAKKVAIEFASFLTRNATVERYSKNGQMFRVAQMVAHNSGFDSDILQAWFKQLNVYLPASFQTLCTMQRAMWLSQEASDNFRPSDFRLVSLCKHFGIEHSPKQAHDAFNDVRATLLLYREMRMCQHASRVTSVGGTASSVGCGARKPSNLVSDAVQQND